MDMQCVWYLYGKLEGKRGYINICECMGMVDGGWLMGVRWLDGYNLYGNACNACMVMRRKEGGGMG